MSVQKRENDRHAAYWNVLCTLQRYKHALNSCTFKNSRFNNEIRKIVNNALRKFMYKLHVPSLKYYKQILKYKVPKRKDRSVALFTLSNQCR